MIAKCGPILLASLGLASMTSPVLGQGNTFNPYGNSGYADYREFGTPMYSNNAALPGQALLNNAPLVGRPRANTYQSYADELDGVDSPSTGGRRGAASNVPYFQAYQRLNGEYSRVYRPNDTQADRDFYQRQKLREQKYAQAMAERDPAKRAKLLREAERGSLAGLNTTRPSTKASTQPRSTAGGAAASPRATAPAERRLTAPSPFADDRPASRAPSPLSGRSSTSTAPSRTRAGASGTRAETDATTDVNSATTPSGTRAPAPPPR